MFSSELPELLPSRAQKETQATLEPSGENTGEKASSAVILLSGVGSEPSAFIPHRPKVPIDLSLPSRKRLDVKTMDAWSSAGVAVGAGLGDAVGDGVGGGS
jgi:hypothetical protein